MGRWQPHDLASGYSSHARGLSVCVQELQCDVSVEEDSRQEWTFTLYDFDNNGKVTREVSAPAGPAALATPSGTPAPPPSPGRPARQWGGVGRGSRLLELQGDLEGCPRAAW